LRKHPARKHPLYRGLHHAFVDQQKRAGQLLFPGRGGFAGPHGYAQPGKIEHFAGVKRKCPAFPGTLVERADADQPLGIGGDTARRVGGGGNFYRHFGCRRHRFQGGKGRRRDRWGSILSP